METIADQKMGRAVFGMNVGLGALAADLGIIYMKFWGAAFNSLAVLLAVLWTLLILTIIMVSAYQYTEAKLDRFYNMPMCPIQDMIWDVEDLVIEPVEETDEPE